MVENVAITFPEPEVVALESLERPRPGPGELLVRTTRTLISTGTELALLTDTAQYTSIPIDTPGYSHVGVVVEIGEGVDEAWLDARVATHAPHRQFACVAVDAATLVPDTVTDEEATFHALAAIAMNGVRQGRLTWGETAAVYGLGLVGQLAARCCHVAGATVVIGLDIDAMRRGYVSDDPGYAVIDPRAGSVPDMVRDRAAGRLADVVFEVTGNAAAIAEQVAALRDRGRFVILGSPRGVEPFDFYHDCHRPGYEIIGAHARTHPPVETSGNQWTRPRHRQLFMSLLTQGRFSVTELISHRTAYDEAAAQYEQLLADRTQALGVIFEWD